MNMEELASVMAKKTGLSKTRSGRILKTILGTIQKELKQGHSVTLPNFGTLQATKTRGKCRVKFDDSDNFFNTPT